MKLVRIIIINRTKYNGALTVPKRFLPLKCGAHIRRAHIRKHFFRD